MDTLIIEDKVNDPTAHLKIHTYEHSKGETLLTIKSFEKDDQVANLWLNKKDVKDLAQFLLDHWEEVD